MEFYKLLYTCTKIVFNIVLIYSVFNIIVFYTKIEEYKSIIIKRKGY